MQAEMTPEEIAAVEKFRKVGVSNPTENEVLSLIRSVGAKAVLESSDEDILEVANTF